MIRVLIADDQKTVRQMLRLFLERESDIEVAGVAASGEEALKQIASLQPDVAIVDLEMPGVDGLAVIKAASQQYAGTKILVFTTHDRDDYVQRVLQSGAHGYLLKTTPAEDIVNAVRSAHKGYVQLGPGLMEKLVADDSLAPSETGITALAPTNSSDLAAKAPSASSMARFDQPVVLRQSPVWSRWILRSIVGVSAGAILWSMFAKIESAVPATGKLEPSGTVQEVQVPVAGVIEEVYVQEGQRVEVGDLLVRLDTTVAEAQEENFTGMMVTLEEENDVLETLLAGEQPSSDWDFDRRALFLSSRDEYNSRVMAADLQISQLQQQLAQNRVQMENERESLAVNQDILTGIEPLFNEGGLSRIQYLRQQQEVQSSLSEIARLTEQQGELQFGIAQAQEQARNARAEFQRTWLERIRRNNLQLAEMDSQLTQAAQTAQYEELRASIAGTIFDLQTVRAGAVVNASEPIMQIVPSDNLVARVLITNRDIGFVHTGMQVDVRISSYNYSEFGDIEGELIRIGSDALPPDEIRPYYAFPAEVELSEQVLRVEDLDLEFDLQSGMEVTANIRTRKRTVLSIFADQFSRQVDSLRTVR